MTRPLSRRVLLALVTGTACMAVLVPGTPSAASTDPGTPTPSPSGSATSGADEDPEDPEDAVPPDPLQVVIERLSPGSLPARGDVRVSGTITNTSDEDWSDLAVYLFTSVDPMTTQAELDAAMVSDPRTDVGDRIVEPGLFTEAPDLGPGEKASFDLSVPVRRLAISGEPGVYWVGVHVLGTNPTGRLEGADGRARTFLPLVPERSPGSELALGVQFRKHVVRAFDGRLRFPGEWQRTLGDDGRLRRLLDFATSAPDGVPVGWVLDPAVVDAAVSVSRGNPPIELAPAEAPEEGTEGTDGEGTEGTGEVTEDGTGDTTAGSGDASGPEQAAADWVDEFFAAAVTHPVLSLPYGDLDVASVARQGVSDLLTAGFGASTVVLDDHDLTPTPVLLPPSGLLAPEVFEDLEPGLPVILAPDALPETSAGPLLNRVDGGRILLSPGPGDMWGPTPGATRSAVAVRQRLLADAALHALSADRDEPLVRFLPPVWDPGTQWQRAQFFKQLDVPWLRAVDVSDVLTGVSVEPVIDPAEDLSYPEASLEAELPLANVLATESLIAEGSTLGELMTEDSDVDEEVVRQALLASSVWSRPRPGVAAARTVAARDRVSGWLDEVTVRGPSFVTMSSETGTFQVTVVNDLDRGVTVGLRASVPGGDLELTTPDPIELPPHSRGAMRIDARSTDIGVHLVTLQPVSAQGTPLGESTQLSVRSSRVGLILWFVMGIGGAALLVAIVLRILRRVRQRRRTHGPMLKRAGA